MGKSKFPGKPSKIVHKKRVSVLLEQIDIEERVEDNSENSEISNSENCTTTTTSIKHGCCEDIQTEADENDGDVEIRTNSDVTNDKKQENLGNRQEMNLISTSNLEPSSETCTTSESNKCDKIDNKQEKEPSASQTSPQQQSSSSKVQEAKELVLVAGGETSAEDQENSGDKNNKKRVTFRNTLETSDDFNVVKKVYNPNFNGPIVSIIKKESLKRPILVYKKNCIVRPSRLTEIVKNSSANNIDKLNSLKFGREYNANHNNLFLSDDKSSNLIVGSKFSAIGNSSSKLIKPGKRFYHNGGDEYASNKKLIKSSSWCNELQDDDSQTSRENKKFGFSFVDELDLKKGFKHKEVFHKSSTSSNVDQNKSILRKPILQFSSFGSFGALEKSPPIKSPFSLNLDNSSLNANSSIFTTSLLCHVCNSITTRKQPRKYGAVCCELCRKFMSKMIKRLASSNKNPLNFQCSKGDGFCSITPANTKNLHKNLKLTSKDRCYACWLKKCLQNFQLPSAVKGRLVNSLPKYLNDLDKISSLSKFSFNLSNPLAKNNFTFGAKPDIKPSVEPSFSAVSGKEEKDKEKDKEAKDAKLECDKDEKEKDKSLSIDIPKESAVSTGMETRSKSSPSIPANQESAGSSLVPAISSSDALRQRVLLKGPRVKHVCRSAQIVLGQPIAVFSNGDESQEVEVAQEKDVDDVKMDLKEESENSAESKEEKKLLEEEMKEVEEDSKDVKMESEEEIKKTQEIEETLEKLEEPEEIPQEITEKLEISETPQISEPLIEEMADDLEEPIKAATKPAKKKEKSGKSQENLKKPDEIKDLLPKRDLFDVSKPITRKLTRPTLSLSQAQNLSRISSTLPSSKRLLFQQFQSQQKIFNPNTIPMISIDFWENYDPAEVSRTGFGLILSERVSIKSLCFLCGSCGVDPMIYCVCCCEPYHYYCVEDEFNIKFQAGAENQNSTDCYPDLDTSGSSSHSGNQNQTLVRRNYDMPFHKRLNWLCPRCTVCHTCNMSTGSKVKCQKCEKNYHATCLGTSKRLLGADRPLICAACLKCKSCGITNVTKFVGNLPMCTNCFKLRQKGNFCPLCQKCYENNDYDLKMMECGDCRRWVHAKCEGLIDEQYNLLSVLPENIEFYCKKCSDNNPLSNVWRDSVAAEFRSSLLSVIRLLSKSRHACALLRMSPRKKTMCNCSKISMFDSEFGQIFLGEEKNCNCQAIPNPLDLIGPNINEIKQKIQENKYHSLHAFNYDMNKILAGAQSEDLQTTYSEIISEIFPWYQNETKACTDALVETMNDAGNEYLDDYPSQEEAEFILQPQPNLPEDVEKEGGFKTFLTGKDTRFCMLCKKEGEYLAEDEGRLLYCGNNTWVHSNCALWSAEVYEEIDGSLQNVHSAISRGRMIKCSKCAVKGATVGCNYKNCGEHYHFMCAKESGVGFMLDKRVFCPQHLDESKNAQMETNFEVNRSVYVELDRKKKKMIEAGKVQFLMGSLYVSKLGKLVPPLSDQQDYLVPVDFECSRLYWSSKRPWTVVEYTVRVSIQRSNYPAPAFDKGVNFTVDHSTNPQTVQRNLKQISIWHSSITQAAQETPEEKKLMISEETNDEEPQNNNDLFPPEIKDAIFEDLPHDVLDGISMFDIFPKNDCRYLETGEEDEEESGDSNDSDLNGFLDNFQEDSFLRKSPSQMKRLSFFQQQKSKNEDQKKRKMSDEQINDTNNNKNGGEELPAAKRISTNLTMKFVNQSEIAKNLFDSKSQFCDLKIPQLDGLNDEIFHANQSAQVLCERCRCTYRNRESFERHLPTCENVAASESGSESPAQNQDQNIFLATSQSNVISMINQQQNQSIPIVINPFQSNQIQSLSNTPISLQLNGDGNLGGLQNMLVDQQGQQIFTAQPLNIGNFGQTILPVRNFPQTTTNIPYLNTSQQFISLPANGGNGQQLVTFAQTSQSDMSGTTTSISHTKKQLILPSQNSGKNKLKVAGSSGQKSLLTKKKEQQVAVKNISVVNYQQQQQGSQQAGLQQPQQQQQIQQTQNIQIFQQPNQSYPLILNQNGNVIQYYPQNDQQNTQLQYLPAITAGAGKTAGNQQIFQNAFPNANNLMLTNGLQVVPVQNQVIGTLIQPQLNQCGLMSAEQMMLAQTPTLEMVSDPTSGCMYLTSQPVYYGLETIVQNTVMSSQQFVSTAMQGVLSQNSSFSATTTQVFQASKIEPIMELPTGYVVLNADGLTAQQQQIAVPQQKITQTSNVLSTPIQQATISEPCYIMEDKKMDPNSWTSGQPIKTTKQKVVPKISKIQPQLVSKVTPTNHETIQKVLNNEEKLKMSQHFVHQQPIQAQFVKVQNQPKKPVKNAYRAIGPKIDDSGVKSAAYIKPKVASKPILPNLEYPKVTQRVPEGQMKIMMPQNPTEMVTLDQTYRTVQNNMIVQANKVQKVKEQQQQQQQQQQQKIECPSLVNIPTNVVNPMQTSNIFNNLNINTTKNKQNVNNRPTNRVLPMQATTQRMGVPGKGKNKTVANPVANPAPIAQPIQQNELIKENYSEKIKSIAMELQSSKNDSLFDRLRLEEPQNNLSPQNTNGYLGNLVCDKQIEDSLSPQPLVIDVRTTTQTTTTLSPSTTTSTYLVPSTSSSTDVSQARMIVQEITSTSLEPPQSDESCLLMEQKIEEKAEEKLETILQEISKEKLSPSSLCPDFDEPSSNSNNLDENSTRNSLDEDDSEFKDEKENYNPIQYSKSASGGSVANIMCDVQQKTPQKPQSCTKVTGPKILFEIQSEDGFTYKSTSITEIWEKLFETVQLARKAHGLMPLPEGRLSEMTGDQMLGLKTNALKYLLEQLPGVEKCSKYTPKYHKSSSVGTSSLASSTATSASSMANNNFSSISSNSSNSNSNLSSASSVLSASMSSLNQYLLSDSDEMLFENIYGAARFEPYSSRSEYDMFSWLASRHRKQPVPVIVTNQNEDNLILRRGTGSNLPMAMKYRTLKETYKKNVGVYRSHIHGRGLFCTRDIEAGEMVIEYAGQLIRSTLTDKRERYYDSKGIGCYMFKIDDNLVVDATMSGTAARFINHSCDPNCYSKVVDILGQKHIIIFALRRIVTGEELTYDYKFPFEDVKIPCSCGAKRCRKYLN